MGVKKIVYDSIAIAEKDLKLNLRYKIQFYTETVVMPIAIVIPFMIVYFGYFALGNPAFWEVNKENFVAYLLLGTITSIALHEGFNSFLNKFQREKYWQTIEGIAIAPIHKISLLISGVIDSIVSLTPAIAILFILANIFYPTTPLNMAKIIIVTILILSISLSLGLVAGLTIIFNENYSPLFRYAIIAVSFLSCLYYPISMFDNHPVLKIFKPVVEINPYYHGVSLLRNIWFFGDAPWISTMYVVVFAAALPFISVYIFNRAWKMFIVQGY